MERLLRIAGIVLVVLAGVFAVSTAIDRGWIGPQVQLAGATVTGLALQAGAVRLRHRSRPWAHSLGAGGAVILAACAVAAHAWLDVIGPLGALSALGVVTATSIALARHLRIEGVAIAAGVAGLGTAAVGGLLGDVPMAVAALSLAAMVVVMTGLGLVERWRGLRIVVGWQAALLLLGFAVDAAGELAGLTGAVAWAVVAVVGTVLWVAPAIAGQLAERPIELGDQGWPRWATIDRRLVVSAPGWTWLAITALAGADATASAWIGLGVAAAHGATVALAWARLDRILRSSGLLAVTGIVTVALVLLLDGPVLMVAIVTSALASAVIADRIDDGPMAALATVVASLATVMATTDLVTVAIDRDPTIGSAAAQGAVVVALVEMSRRVGRRWRPVGIALGATAWIGLLGWVATQLSPIGPVVPAIAATWAILAALILVLGRYRWVPTVAARAAGLATLSGAAILTMSDLAALIETGSGDLTRSALQAIVIGGAAIVVAALGLRSAHRPTAIAVMVGTWVLALGWVLGATLDVGQSQAVVSALWTVAAIAAIVAGLRLTEVVARRLGMATLGVTMVKLLTVDLTEVDVLWRIGLFAIVGAGLLRLAYVLPRLVAPLDPDVQPSCPSMSQH